MLWKRFFLKAFSIQINYTNSSSLVLILYRIDGKWFEQNRTKHYHILISNSFVFPCLIMFHYFKTFNYSTTLTLFVLDLSFDIINIDLPDPRSDSGSSRIQPFFAWIRIRPDLNLKKKTGFGRILILKKIRIRFWSDPSWNLAISGSS